MSSPQSSHSAYPLTGQQLMMQLDSVTSSLVDLAVTNTTTDTSTAMDTGNQQQHLQQQQQHQHQHLEIRASMQNRYYKFKHEYKSPDHTCSRPFPPTCVQKCILWDY